MSGRPAETEAPPYFWKYIQLVEGDDIAAAAERQLDDSLPVLESFSEEASLARYAPDKWSVRQVLNHVTDTERAIGFRALWFARGFETPMPGFDQDVAVAGAAADSVSWADHVEEFRRVRLATVSMFRNMPDAAWTREGANPKGDRYTVRALAFVIAGHLTHHLHILQEKYR